MNRIYELNIYYINIDNFNVFNFTYESINYCQHLWGAAEQKHVNLSTRISSHYEKWTKRQFRLLRETMIQMILGLTKTEMTILSHRCVGRGERESKLEVKSYL